MPRRRPRRRGSARVHRGSGRPLRGQPRAERRRQVEKVREGVPKGRSLGNGERLRSDLLKASRNQNAQRQFVQLHASGILIPSACVTRNPDSAWITQQARNLVVGERLGGIRFVIRDRGQTYSGPFDEVFRSEGVSIVRTPIRAPRANAFAERWVRTVRAECLDWMLVLGRRHLERVLRIYAAHYNGARPHRGLDLRTPRPRPDPTRRPSDGVRVRRHDVLGGLIREYELAA